MHDGLVLIIEVPYREGFFKPSTWGYNRTPGCITKKDFLIQPFKVSSYI